MNLDAGFLKGSYPPVVTPFRDGQVDLDQYAQLVDRQVAEGSHGILVCGTTGEPSSLTIQERSSLLKVAVETVASRVPVVAATGSQSFKESELLSREAEQIGADALLIVTPYYIRPSVEGLHHYFLELSQKIGLPWMIYHIPGRAAVSMKPEAIARLAQESPTLVGIKHAVNDLDFVTELLTLLGPDFRIFCGLESLSLPMLAVGAAGLMNAVGNLAPRQVAQLCEAVFEGKLNKARRIHFELFELNRAIFLKTNPIPLKYMMSRLGFLERSDLRLPLYPADKKDREILDRVLSEAGLLESVSAS